MLLRRISVVTIASLLALHCASRGFNRSDKVSNTALITASTAPDQTAEDPALSPPSTTTSQEQAPGQIQAPSQKPTAGQGLFFDCGNEAKMPIVAKLYRLPTGTKTLPVFEQLPALKTICMPQLNISKRNFSRGFPGVEDLYEWFGLDIAFKLKILADGDYSFRLSSDDGSRLYIDGRKVIDNDGEHAAQSRTATVALRAGVHRIEVDYFQGPKYEIALELQWKQPGAQNFAYISPGLMDRP